MEEIKLENIKILNISPDDSLIIKVDAENFRGTGSVEIYENFVKDKLGIDNNILLIDKNTDLQILKPVVGK